MVKFDGPLQDDASLVFWASDRITQPSQREGMALGFPVDLWNLPDTELPDGATVFPIYSLTSSLFPTQISIIVLGEFSSRWNTHANGNLQGAY